MRGADAGVELRAGVAARILSINTMVPQSRAGLCFGGEISKTCRARADTRRGLPEWLDRAENGVAELDTANRKANIRLQ